MEENRNGAGPHIRPRDPKVIGLTTTHMPISPADVIRRLLHFTFRDAVSVLDLTYAGGNFWGDPLPPEITLTTNNIDPAADTGLHVDFTATGGRNGAYDVVVLDPPHNADAGTASFMRERYGTVKGTDALQRLIQDGAKEAWRIAKTGVIIKVQDQNHGSEYLEESQWVRSIIPARPYIVLDQLGSPTPGHGRRKLHQRVPYRSASTYLVFRKDGPTHHDWDAEYLRQEGARCTACSTLLIDRRRQSTTCSPACRQKAYRQRSVTT